MIIKFFIILIFFSVFFIVACDSGRYTWSKAKWQNGNTELTENNAPFFDEINRAKLKDLHGKEVQVRGRLVYHYDEAAIYPFNEGDFKPVWIAINAENIELHQFLMEHAGGMVTAIGTIDTTELIDSYTYSSSISDINYVSAISLKDNQRY